jgi:hypothetical protein
MKRSPFIAAAAIALMAATPVAGLITTPAAAQGWRGGDRDRGDGELRELLREVLMDGGMEGRQGRRQERREDRRDDRRDDIRGMLLDNLGEDDADRRGRLRERVRTLRDREDDDDGRGRLRERAQTLRDRDGDDDGAGRSRLRQRIAERRDGGCYFLTRSLRDEDGDLLVTVRRRRCPD